MPYQFPDKLPKVAINWSESRQRKCVAAANAVLDRGGSEENAIFACIHAAKENRRDQGFVKIETKTNLVSIAKTKNKKIKKPPIPPHTKTLEIQYFKDLRNVIQSINEIVESLIIPSLSSILKQQESLVAGRLDDASDEIEKLKKTMTILFEKAWTDRDFERLSLNSFTRTNNQSQQYFSRLYKQQIGIDLFGGEPWLKNAGKLYISENVDLIKGLEAEYRRRVASVITRGATQGKLIKDIKDDLNNVFNFGENRARLIARDQTAKLYSQVQEERQRDAGVSKYTWSTSLDERVRPSHRRKEGNVYSWDSPPADTGHPGEDFQCRCVAIPVIE